MNESRICNAPEETFDLGSEIGSSLRARDAVLIHGGLGAGKTLLTKGILSALEFDVDEVTSPSFTLVNLYKTPELDIYHIDLWRIDDGSNAAFGVGLGEIVEQLHAVVIIEWAERLGSFEFPARVIDVTIDGEGDDPRMIKIEYTGEKSESAS
jgi:tRNA threonylcarbamoyladenosine biosynthesis protein TsaE